MGSLMSDGTPPVNTHNTHNANNNANNNVHNNVYNHHHANNNSDIDDGGEGGYGPYVDKPFNEGGSGPIADKRFYQLDLNIRPPRTVGLVSSIGAAIART